MHKQLLIVMLICLKGADYISAQQWTKKDSVWLQNVLSGKGTESRDDESDSIRFFYKLG